jgi:cyanophycin synthetase
LAQLICKGISQEKPDGQYEIILNEIEAINSGLDRATPGGLVVILPETVGRAISLIEARHPLPENLSETVTADTQAYLKSSVVHRV